MSEDNQTIALESDDIEFMERREAAQQGVPLFTAHWHVYVPSFIICALFLTIWLILLQLGQAASGTGRFFIVTMSVITPLLGAWAFLRYQTIRLQVHEGHLYIHPGWPREIPADIPQEMVKSATVSRGLLGRLFGGGDVIVTVSDGRIITVPDLARPEAASKSILNMRV